jgi:DNA primase
LSVAGRILREDVEALKRRLDLADVVSDHTKLQRAGSRMKGLCPFHEEKTPSFHVDPGLGLYHCFGCQEGGDVYTFVQRIERLDFSETVEQLARRVGMELRYEEMSAGRRRELGERSRLVAANQAAVAFFRESLLAGAGQPACTARKTAGGKMLTNSPKGMVPPSARL